MSGIIYLVEVIFLHVIINSRCNSEWQGTRVSDTKYNFTPPVIQQQYNISSSRKWIRKNSFIVKIISNKCKRDDIYVCFYEHILFFTPSRVRHPIVHVFREYNVNQRILMRYNHDRSRRYDLFYHSISIIYFYKQSK